MRNPSKTEKKSLSTDYSRDNPYQAKIKRRFRLNQKGSSKDVWHVVLETEGIDLDFKVGDSIGVEAKNPMCDVRAMMELAKIENDAAVEELLLEKVNFNLLSGKTIKRYLELRPCKHLEQLSHDRAAMRSYLAEHDLLSFFKEHPIDAEQFKALLPSLPPLLPRFYSIASSPHVSENEIHLTVGCFSYTHAGREKHGIATHYLCYVADVEATPIPIYNLPSAHFALPSPETDIIMIGPGTGVAPFRGFIEERIYQRATGRNWLFFGECHSASDYYYRDEFEEHVRANRLRIDCAFSRDQKEKVYVQHKILENSATFAEWVKNGAVIYICGDAKRMARDVTLAIEEVLEKEWKLPQDKSREEVKRLRKEKKLLLDTY